MNWQRHVFPGIFFVLVAFCCAADAAGLAEVQNWGFQLDRISPAEIAGAPFDLVVVDYSRDGSQNQAFTPREVQAMQQKPDGGRRIVVAYLSIGEAEDYRYYWHQSWKNTPPSWLDAENPDWPGNYKVKFWEEGWQKVLYGSPAAYLDRILAAGFDGIYLDIIDAFEYYEERYPDAGQRMAELVKSLADYARTKNSGFVIIAQNGEPLVTNSLFLATIDGLAKEDLFYEMEEEGQRNPEEEILYSLDFLEKVRAAEKKVFVVTYTKNPQQTAEVLRESRQRGFLPYATIRELDRLAPDESGASVPKAVNVARTFTPGGSRNGALEKGEMRFRLGYEHYQEESTYEEYEEPGTLTYRDRTQYQVSTLSVQTSLGLGGGFEAGIGISGVSADEDYREEVGGDMATSATDRGLNRIGVYASQCTTFADEAGSVQMETEFGLPSPADDQLYSEGAGANLTLTTEYFPERLGIIGRLSEDWAAEEDFDRWHDTFSYHGGLGFDISADLFTTLLVGESGDLANFEASVEYLLSPLSSLEATYIQTIDGEPDYWTFQIQCNILFR